jgi:pimeloyl-ACP methyl ester carboxylesterase
LFDIDFLFPRSRLGTQDPEACASDYGLCRRESIMHNRLIFTLLAVCVLSSLALQTRAAEPIPLIARALPPEGLEIPADVRTRLETRLAATKKRLEDVKDSALKPDIEIFTKAVELALIHREFYVERDFSKADWALDEASVRLDSLDAGIAPWTSATGLVVEGYRSSIDGSTQPYGLVIPEGHDLTKPCPLYVWLHGRGDKNTDLHFLNERATRPGQITPAGAIVVHPFGRHCVGWKHAGEIDVLEVVNTVKQRYKIDQDRVVLIGFSMGGAGAWHIGAHYTERWVAVSPGAGFVDVARYQKLTPDRYPEWYVQKLWGLYDVPDYVRNLFNTNVVAYSGELDKQREAAVIMEEAFEKEGRKLTHLIGPGVEHKYEPETLKELLKRLDAIVAKGQQWPPSEVHLQTRTLRYPARWWVAAEGLEEHWRDSRIDGVKTRDALKLTTVNVNRLKVLVPSAWSKLPITLDKQEFSQVPGDGWLHPPFVKEANRWRLLGEDEQDARLRKARGFQGPIDDAFLSRFTVIVPSKKSSNVAFQNWCDYELEHFRSRWRALMRGELLVRRDVDAENDLPDGNLILWGDAESNTVIRRFSEKLPVRFDAGSWSLGETKYDGNRFVPACVFPRPDKPNTNADYIVLNSGLTFREAHDRTNSQQNPKLPDWAIIDITQPPDANSPGRVHDADFFDEQWQLKRQPKAP